MIIIFSNKESIIRIVVALLLEMHIQYLMDMAVLSKDALKEVIAESESSSPCGEGKQ